MRSNMKKFILGIVMVLALASCDMVQTGVGSAYEGDSILLLECTIETVKFNGHEYIMFDKHYGICAVHSPDCPCLTK
jgi:hypothetical protein